jgi:hypothetical protein
MSDLQPPGAYEGNFKKEGWKLLAVCLVYLSFPQSCQFPSYVTTSGTIMRSTNTNSEAIFLATNEFPDVVLHHLRAISNGHGCYGRGRHDAVPTMLL